MKRGSPSPIAIESVEMSNVLSFGPDAVRLELGPLTVLIGPNGSGKSNLLEVMYLLSRLPRASAETSLPIVDWIWKGAKPDESARVETIVRGSDFAHTRAAALRHRIDFGSVQQRFSVLGEQLTAIDRTEPASEEPYFFRHKLGLAQFLESESPLHAQQYLKQADLSREHSVLGQRNDPDAYPEIAHVGSVYEGIRVYRDINFGPRSPTRVPQRTDAPTRVLLEDGSNLGLVLSRLKANTHARKRLDELLRRFYEGADSVDVQIEGNTAQIYLVEEHWNTPATRLSDGTMRWLTLLAVLLDPNPPRIVCFDEPDLGLHPDVIPALSDLLVEASQRMQIIATTHSDAFVDSLTERPEAVVVCEKRDGKTDFTRLSQEKLAAWLDKYSLGELWNSGQLGGRRF